MRPFSSKQVLRSPVFFCSYQRFAATQGTGSLREIWYEKGFSDGQQCATVWVDVFLAPQEEALHRR